MDVKPALRTVDSYNVIAMTSIDEHLHVPRRLWMRLLQSARDSACSPDAHIVDGKQRQFAVHTKLQSVAATELHRM